MGGYGWVFWASSWGLVAWHTGTGTASASYSATGKGQGEGHTSCLVSMGMVRSEDLGGIEYIDRE